MTTLRVRGAVVLLVQLVLVYFFFAHSYYSKLTKLVHHHTHFRILSNEPFVPPTNANRPDSLTEKWPSLAQTVTLQDDTRSYFLTIANKSSCYIQGTDLSASTESCVCLNGFHGVDCGIPSLAWYEQFKDVKARVMLRKRQIPRRIIQGIVINHEFELMEVRMNELEGVVDAYIIGESNYSTKGDPKPLRLMEKLQQGFLKKFQPIMVYVLQTFYPQKGLEDGWYAEGFMRTHMSVHGLPRVINSRPDDLFLSFDADEIPSVEALMFLKLYDGYSEPIGFTLRWSLFGFFWKVPFVFPPFPFSLFVSPRTELATHIVSGATLAFLETFCDNDALCIRKLNLTNTPNSILQEYEERNGHLLSLWWIGSDQHFAGHHCSWCLVPEDIVIKLKMANREDKPRWGDYPEKLNLDYIKGLIRDGKWFDDETVYQERKITSNDYAPKYVLQHPHEFKRFLKNPYS